VTFLATERLPGWRGLVAAARRRVANRLRGRQESVLAGTRLLEGFADAYPNAYFVEVGSNDGEQHDHLRPFIRTRGWSGLMVEPVPYVFERLRRNYGELERIALENAAIADHDGVALFHHLAEADAGEREGLPRWYDGIGSLSRDSVLGHAREIPDLERRLVASEVPCLTFESLCRKHRVERIDLLLIDTEGYDWEVVRQIDFAVHAPRMLVYEHFHLSPPDRGQCREHLASAGYRILEEGFDTFCLHRDAAPPVQALWLSLRPAVRPLTEADKR